MNAILVIVITVILSSCTLFEKNESNNELESLSEDVLKKNEGVRIEVSPLLLEHSR